MATPRMEAYSVSTRPKATIRSKPRWDTAGGREEEVGGQQLRDRDTRLGAVGGVGRPRPSGGGCRFPQGRSWELRGSSPQEGHLPPQGLVPTCRSALWDSLPPRAAGDAVCLPARPLAQLLVTMEPHGGGQAQGPNLPLLCRVPA